MAMTEQGGPVSGSASGATGEGPGGASVWTPGGRAEGALAKPVSRGMALALTAVVLAAGAWGLTAQSQALSRVQVSVDQLTGPSTGSPPAGADPELCWLIGTDAFAAGRGPQLLRAIGSVPVTTDCWTAVRQGAQGLPRT